MTLNMKPDTFLLIKAKRGLKRVAHSFKLLLPDDLLRSCDACFQTSLTATGMKALRCPGTF